MTTTRLKIGGMKGRLNFYPLKKIDCSVYRPLAQRFGITYVPALEALEALIDFGHSEANVMA